MISSNFAPRPDRDRFLRRTGMIFLIFGAALVLAPFQVFAWLVRLLPWMLGAPAALTAAAALRKPPPGPAGMIFACVALGAAVWLGIMAQFRDRALWYLAAALLLWSACRVLGSAFRGGAAAWERLPGALLAGLFAGLMVIRPRSGFSAALTIFGTFALAWGVMLLALPRRAR